MLGTFLAGVTSADGRLWRSIRLLLTRPGALTAESLRGARAKQLGPVQVFLVANLVALLIGPLLGASPLAATNAALLPEYSAWAASVREGLGVDEAAFDSMSASRTDVLARVLFFVLVPLMAWISAALHWRSGREFGAHVVFACHFLAFYLLVPDTLLGAAHERAVKAIGVSIVYEVATWTRFLLPWAASACWLAAADRRVFGAETRLSWRNGIVASTLFSVLAVAGYKFLLGAGVLWSLG